MKENIAIILVSEGGLPTARLISHELGDAPVFTTHSLEGCQTFPSYAQFMAAHFREYDLFVFIGGHGGRLADMLRKIDSVMRPGGVIVFNSVSEESRQLFTEGLAVIGGRITECVRLTVDAHNAIDVMKVACTLR